MTNSMLRSPTTDTDQFLVFLTEFASHLATPLGSNSEIVIHDFRRVPEGTIVAIFGDLTDRKIGGSMSRIGLEVIGEGNDAQDRYGYVSTTTTGRTLKASTLVLRDHQGNVFGAFCINVDVTDLRRASVLLSELAGFDQAEPDTPDVVFSNDPAEVIRSIVAQEAAAVGIPATHLSREEREQLVLTLEKRGIFSMQKGAQIAAKQLGVSRTTIYNDLNSIKSAD